MILCIYFCFHYIFWTAQFFFIFQWLGQKQLFCRSYIPISTLFFATIMNGMKVRKILVLRVLCLLDVRHVSRLKTFLGWFCCWICRLDDGRDLCESTILLCTWGDKIIEKGEERNHIPSLVALTAPFSINICDLICFLGGFYIEGGFVANCHQQSMWHCHPLASHFCICRRDEMIKGKKFYSASTSKEGGAISIILGGFPW